VTVLADAVRLGNLGEREGLRDRGGAPRVGGLAVTEDAAAQMRDPIRIRMARSPGLSLYDLINQVEGL
jgi:hypothetical protein